jgi:predicted Zn-dependent protease
MSYNDPNQPQRSSGGIYTRIIMALMIAFIGWIMYMSHTEKNPVTGEKQHVAITPDQEVRMGLESAPEMTREMGGEVSASDPRAIEVKKIGQQLLEASDAKESPWQFKFHLLSDDKTVNAFALPGGQVFITLGLLDKLSNEAELAGVLGHEMGHVIERHSAQQMAKSQLGQWMIVAVSTGASSDNQSGSSSTPLMVASLVNQVIQMRFSRHDESQADIWGLKIMQQAGYNPQAMISVMEVLKEASGKGAPLAIFQTHPDPDLRIKQIKEYLAANPPKPNLSEGGSLKELVRQSQGEDRRRIMFDIFQEERK